MNISIRLSVQSIENAITRLSDIRDILDKDIGKVTEAIAAKGAEEANKAYGNWKVSAVAIPAGESAMIHVSGDMPLIAEFGAGDATLDPSAFFENRPSTFVFPGSYSMEHEMEYTFLGEWRFNGRWMSEVPPRQGLYKAKTYIIEKGADIAKEVLKL